MTIKLSPRRVMSAYKAIRELSGQVFPYQTARAVMALKKRLDEEFSTALALENALVSEFGGETDGSGRFRFPDEEAEGAFLEKYRAAMDETAEIRLPRLDLSRYAGNLRLSAETLEALDGIVQFEEASDNGR